MKIQHPAQAKQSGTPASQHAQEGASAAQLKAQESPRQAKEAAHIAQLKGDAKAKGKAAPKKAKGK